MGGERITSDDWLQDYQKECPETPEFPSGPAPFSGDGDFDAHIPTNMDPSLRLPVSYDTTDHRGGGSGPAAEPVPQDRHVVLHAADNAIEAELHENERRITSDVLLQDYQKEFSEPPVFPSDPAPFSGDGDFDAPIPSMDPSLCSSVSHDTYLKGIDHRGGGSGPAAEPVPQDRHVILHAADNAIEAELHDNERPWRVSDKSAVQAERDDESMMSDYTFDSFYSDNDFICFPEQAAEVDAREVRNDSESISEQLRDMNLAPSRQGVQQVDLSDRKCLAPVAGRGGEGNYHPGNKRFRKTVSEIQPEYTKNIMRPNKTKPSTHIEERVNNYGGATDVVSDTFVHHESDHESDTEYVVKPKDWDIVAGRGGGGNHNLGNKRFRKIVSRIKPMYKDTKTNKKAKKKLSKHIVEHVKNYGGRFLEKDPQGRYVIMEEVEAIEKTSQALRENVDNKWINVDVEEGEDFYEEANRIAEQG